MKTWQKLKKNPSLWPRYFAREKTLKAIRSFFENTHVHEVETPVLIEYPPAESYLDVFETTLLDRTRRKKNAYLSTSPETALKKLLVAGIGDCYSLTKSFRNTETGGVRHNPEFTILEWYRVGATYEDIMVDCENLVAYIVASLSPAKKSSKLVYQGVSIDLSSPWERISISQAFEKYAHVDFDRFLDSKEALSIVKEKGYQTDEKYTWEEYYNQIYLNEIEPNLGKDRPTIIYDFPGEFAALARKKESDPRFAERFELYIGGLELADCYSELTDAEEQRQRFEKELTELKRLGKTTYDFDHDFIDALREGLPPCSGIALGVDRLIMLLSDAKAIDDVLFFPMSEWNIAPSGSLEV